jgi:hypothetical protein
MAWNNYGHVLWIFIRPGFFIAPTITGRVIIMFLLRGRHRARGALEFLKEQCARSETVKTELHDRRHLLDA